MSAKQRLSDRYAKLARKYQKEADAAWLAGDFKSYKKAKSLEQHYKKMEDEI